MNDTQPGRKTILIVDDTETNIHMLMALLKEYDLIPALSGEEALKALEAETVDLILLDIMMPGMDGFEVCSRVKADPVLEDIPVIFLTARSDEDSITRAYDAGGADYVTKPFRPRELMARVKIQFELRDTILDLKTALANVKTLSGLVPICSRCKKIRDDQGYWESLESYLARHSDAAFSHGLCNGCSDELYGDEEWYLDLKGRKK